MKLVGVGVLSVGAVVTVVTRSGRVSGDTSLDGSAAPVPAPDEHDPFTPYPLGPGAISYDQSSAADKAALDAERATVVSTQSAASIDEWTNAVSEAADRSQAQIAARQVGLENTAQDGVVP